MAPETDRAYRQHNHQHCVEDALENARRVCEQNSARFTRLREQVFTLIWSSHKPLGAYAILEQLMEGADGQRRPAPPTVYRALNFLLDQGLVHRIASLNAYIGCDHPEQPHSSQFLICRSCSTTIELTAQLPPVFEEQARASGFQIESTLLELSGLCPNCAPASGCQVSK
jgi:Fur family zinc uptake transcriptional regulator